MKTKKFGKKLCLNKKTIVDFKHIDMRNVRGGEFFTEHPISICCTEEPDCTVWRCEETQDEGCWDPTYTVAAPQCDTVFWH